MRSLSLLCQRYIYLRLGGVAGPCSLRKLIAFFQNLLQLIDILQFLVQRMIRCGMDAREPAARSQPWVSRLPRRNRRVRGGALGQWRERDGYDF